MSGAGGVGVLRDPEPLERSYLPARIVGRDEERAELRRALDEALSSSDPRHVAVYGGEGRGKTLLVDDVAAELRRDRAGTSGVHRASCRDHESPYRVAISLTNAMRSGEPLASSGYATDEVLDALTDALAASAGDVVVLDDLSSLDLADVDVERLLEALLSESGVAVALVASDPRTRNDLAWSVRQSVAGREVHLPPYDGAVLQTILEDRAERAFRDGALAEDVVPAAAGLAVEEDDGNAWTAIDLLARAARLAGERAADVVTAAHVRDAFGDLRSRRIRDALPATPHAALALLALVEAATSPDLEPRMRHCYRRYLALCEAASHDPVGERAVQGYLDAFRRAELVEAERQHSDAPGQYYVYHLTEPPTQVVAALRGADVPQAAFDASSLDARAQ